MSTTFEEGLNIQKLTLVNLAETLDAQLRRGDSWTAEEAIGVEAVRTTLWMSVDYLDSLIENLA